MGKEELHEVGNGCVVAWMWLGDVEVIAEVSREGIDEGCDKEECGQSWR